MMPQEARKLREKDYDTVVADDLRPAGNGKDCFYCGIPLGFQHKDDCVIRLGAGQYHVAIRHNATGEVRMYRHDMLWTDDEDIWLEGNYSCDCNKYLFFERAIGNDPHWDLAECGDTKYAVLYAELPDGIRIYLQSNPVANEKP